MILKKRICWQFWRRRRIVAGKSVKKINKNKRNFASRTQMWPSGIYDAASHDTFFPFPLSHSPPIPFEVLLKCWLYVFIFCVCFSSHLISIKREKAGRGELPEGGTQLVELVMWHSRGQGKQLIHIHIFTHSLLTDSSFTAYWQHVLSAGRRGGCLLKEVVRFYCDHKAATCWWS